MDTHVLRVTEARRFKHPSLTSVEKHFFLVRAAEMPKGIRNDANARDATGLNGRVYRQVKESLLGRDAVPGSFDLMNKGITIVADSVRRIDDHNYEVSIKEGQGIVDGGHTYQLVIDNQADPDLPAEQYVEVQVRTGIAQDLITAIARGLNTGMQVKNHSIDDLAGKYDWLKELIADKAYASKIAWSESDKGDFDVRDLICVLELFNVFDFPNDKSIHPIQAYEKWSAPAIKFSKDYDDHKDNRAQSKYYRLAPLLKEALILHDMVRKEFRQRWNDAGGAAGKLRIVEEAPRGKTFEFLFTGGHDQYRLTKGALYPILAAFRNKVFIDENGNAAWEGGFQSVQEFWHFMAPEVCNVVRTAIDDIGNHPDAIGKNRGHWSNLHKTADLYLTRQRLADMQKGRRK